MVYILFDLLLILLIMTNINLKVKENFNEPPFDSSSWNVRNTNDGLYSYLRKYLILVKKQVITNKVHTM